MQQNESGIDRIIRIVVGLILLIIGGLNVSTTLGIVLLVLGVVLIFTGITGFCLIYKIFKFSTKK